MVGSVIKYQWDKVPRELVDLEIPLDLMIKVSEFVHFAASRKHSAYEKHVIDDLDIILNSGNLPDVNKKYIIYFLTELRPIQ
jgi:hypothetical protein